MPGKKFLLLLLLSTINYHYVSGQDQFYDTIQKNKIAFRFEDLNSIVSSTKNFPDKRFYLFGELHAIQADLQLEYAFLKYLQKEKGINNILIEMPHSEVYFFQKYLETGDTALLYGYDGRINKAFLDSIRGFNKTIANPVRLFGIDLDIQFRGYFYADCIMHIAKTHYYADTLSVFGKAIKQLTANRDNKERLFELNEIIKQELTAHEALLISLFGKDYLHLKTIVFSVKKDKGRRDDEMYENFKKLDNTWFSGQDHKARFLAFFGGSHTYSENTGSLYHLLQSNAASPVLNDVSLSVIQYVNCQSSQFGLNPPYLVQVSNDGFFKGNNSTYKKLVKSDFLDAIGLVCTNNPNSNFIIPAYSGQPFYPWYKKNKMLESVDMLFIIQNSGPTHPVKQTAK